VEFIGAKIDGEIMSTESLKSGRGSLLLHENKRKLSEIISVKKIVICFIIIQYKIF